MNRLILAIILLFSTFSASHSWASGSNTVFLPVKSRQFFMINFCDDVVSNPELQYYLQTAKSPIYVATLSPSVYRIAHYYAINGYDVELGFEGMDSVVFRYYESVDAIIGFNAKDNPIILLPAY